MANTTRNTKTNTKSSSTTKVTTPATNEVEQIKIKDIDPEQYVVVRNGFQGRLVYKSSRTGERFVWSEFGDEQEMQLRELRAAKNTYKKFFINNWFMFDEEWIIDYLGVRQYYQNALSIDNFDEIFSKSPAELKKLIANLSEGQKKSVAYRATMLIAEEKIDSRKTISTLEDALGIELVEG